MGDFETCELCDGTGSVIGDRPVTLSADIKVLVLEARYAAGIPLFRSDDGWIPPDKSREEPDYAALFGNDPIEPASDFEDECFLEEQIV